MAMPTAKSRPQLATTLQHILNEAATVRSIANAFRLTLIAGPIASTQVIEYHNQLRAAYGSLVAKEGVTGIVAYARDQLNDQVLDIVVEYQAMKSAIEAVLQETLATLPKVSGTNHYALHEELNGQIAVRTFGPGASATLQGLLLTLENSVESPV